MVGNLKLSELTAAGAVSGTDLFYSVDTVNGTPKKQTASALLTYVQSGFGAGVATALGVNVGSAGAFVTFNGAGGTPSSMIATNLSGTAASLTAGHVTTNANLTGDVTSLGNATTLQTVNSNVGTFGNSTNIAQVTVNAKGLVTAVSNVSVTIPSAANPTASIGTSVVNGSATTFMRSDAAPPIDQTAAFAFSGLGATTVAANGAASVAPLLQSGTILTGGTATTNFPAHLIQPTGTTAVTSWSTNGTAFGVNAPSGYSGNILDFHINGAASSFRVSGGGSIVSSGSITITGAITVGSGQQLNWTSGGILTSAAAATLQLGAVAADTTGVSQTLRAQGVTTGGTNNQAGGDLTIASGQGKGNVGSTIVLQTPTVGASGNTLQTMTAALTLGPGTQLTAPGAMTLGSLSVGSINSSGNINAASTGAIYFNTRSVLSSAANGKMALQNNAQDDNTDTMLQFGLTTSAAAMFKRTKATTVIQARLADDSGYAQIYAGTLRTDQTTVANLPAAATAGAGATAFVTDANATFILGLGLTVVGGGGNKVPVYSDGTNWIVG